MSDFGPRIDGARTRWATRHVLFLRVEYLTRAHESLLVGFQTES